MSVLSPRCCFPSLTPKFIHVHKGHRTCPATSCARGAVVCTSGYCPSPLVAIKIVSTTEAPVELSRKFLPREISSLNATYKHLNVVGRDIRTACSHPAHPGGQPAPRLLLTPGPPHSPPGTLCSGPNPILRPQASALHSPSLG